MSSRERRRQAARRRAQVQRVVATAQIAEAFGARSPAPQQSSARHRH